MPCIGLAAEIVEGLHVLTWLYEIVCLCVCLPLWVVCRIYLQWPLCEIGGVVRFLAVASKS